MLNDAALLAVRSGRSGRSGRSSVSQPDLDTAVQRILEAPERQRRLSMKDKGIGRRSSSEERLTFAEVAGVEDAIQELAEVRDYLADPDRFTALGARVPRGILLRGLDATTRRPTNSSRASLEHPQRPAAPECWGSSKDLERATGSPRPAKAVAFASRSSGTSPSRPCGRPVPG